MEKILTNLYQKFLGKVGNRREKFFFFFLFFLIIFGSNILFRQRLDQDELFWVFSTIAQVLAVLVSLFVILGIYKIGSIKNDIERRIDSIKDIFYAFNKYFPHDRHEEIVRQIKETIKRNRHPSLERDFRQLEEAGLRIDDLLSYKELIKDSGRDFVLWSFLTILICLLTLTFIAPISGVFLSSVIILVFVFFSFSYSVFLIIKFTEELLS